jgi:hypothetical protein
MEDNDLIDPAKAYALHRYNVLNATMEYNLAIAKLANALRVGCFIGFFAIVPDDEPPEWTAYNRAQIHRVNEVVRHRADLL